MPDNEPPTGYARPPFDGSRGIWQQHKKENKLIKFHSWPKPFNYLKRLDVLNCNEVLMLRASFFLPVAAEIWIDANVPSPTELFRNWIFGSLKCGKKMGLKPRIPGPFDIFFSKKGRVALVAFGGILGAPLMWYAMGQTAWTAMDAWSTIVYKQAMCAEPDAHGIMRDGHVRAQFAGTGSVPFFIACYDPWNWGNEVAGTWDVPFGSRFAWATGTLTNVHATITAEIGIAINMFGPGEPNWAHYSLAPGETADFGISASGDGPGPVQVSFKLDNDLPGVLTGVNVTPRFFMVTNDANDPMRRSMDDPWRDDPDPYDTCQLLYEAPAQ